MCLIIILCYSTIETDVSYLIDLCTKLSLPPLKKLYEEYTLQTKLRLKRLYNYLTVEK